MPRRHANSNTKQTQSQPPCDNSASLPAGLHLIEVLLDEVQVPKSPFRVSVAEGCEPGRVRAYGPGLEEGLVNKPNNFTVETR